MVIVLIKLDVIVQKFTNQYVDLIIRHMRTFVNCNVKISIYEILVHVLK